MTRIVGVICAIVLIAGCASGPAGHGEAVKACKEWQQYQDEGNVPLSYAIEDAYVAAKANPKYQELKSDLDAAGSSVTPGSGVSSIINEDCASI